MRSVNSEHRRQNIDTRNRMVKAESGQAEYVLGMYALIFVMVLAMALLQILQYKADSDIAEDALAASCLAALEVDPYRYGLDHALIIDDPVHAREVFEDALRKNMNLDEKYEPYLGGDKYIAGKVTIEDFRIYLISGSDVREIQVDAGRQIETDGIYGEMRTPHGCVVRSAGVYARISFDSGGFLGTHVEARKEAYAEMHADPDRSATDRS